MESKNIDLLKQFNLEKTLKSRLSSFFSEFPNIHFQRLKQEPFQIKIENIGKFMILGVDLEREKNDFIHEYEMKRNGMKLLFKKKQKIEEKKLESKEEILLGRADQMSKSWQAKIRDNFYIGKSFFFVAYNGNYFFAIKREKFF